MRYLLSNGKEMDINTIVLDLNGTISVNGKLVNGVKERIQKLKKLGFKIILFTGNQRGTASNISKELDVECKITENGKEKKREMLKLDYKKCASIGNARIDIPTFKYSKLAILTLQAEGVHAKTIKYADLIVPSINDALDLFLNKDSLIATLKE